MTSDSVQQRTAELMEPTGAWKDTVGYRLNTCVMKHLIVGFLTWI